MIRIRPFLAGLASWFPGLAARSWFRTGGSISARYCYSVWLRHLVNLRDHGIPYRFDAVAELGPGDSLGTGLAALLSGARRLDALEVVPHDTNQRNLEILDELVDLFSARAEIPGEAEFPRVKPRLSSYAFPSDLFSDAHLDETLAPARVEAIRRAILGEGRPGDPVKFRYRVPWNNADLVEPESVDLILSQAVLEHVDDLPGAYGAMFQWLKPGGVMSHEVDFASHGITTTWNGHWALPDPVWWLIRGRRPFLINRRPLSYHIARTDEAGFRLAVRTTHLGGEGTPRIFLAPGFRSMSDEDLAIRGATLVSVRPS